MGNENLEALLNLNILTKELIETTKVDSVNRGWFLAQSEKHLYDSVKEKTVLILGCGGLGSHSAWAMTALGIKKMILIDDDNVSIDNLNRQLLYDQADINHSKVSVLKNKLSKINPDIEIVTYKRKITNPYIQLSDILTLHDPVNLVIKAVDTPDNHMRLFSDYFSHMNIPYTSGGTLGNGIILGPTYHPSLPNHYQKEIAATEELTRVHVKGTSLPMIMEKVAAEVNLEALNILCNRIDKVRFNDSISYENLYEPSISREKRNLRIFLFLIVGLISTSLQFLVLFLIFWMISSKKEMMMKVVSLASGFAFSQAIQVLLRANVFTIHIAIICFILFFSSIPLAIFCLCDYFIRNYRRISE
ncbi:HesA/MoeB/ThiF family protein [Enterococcus sp. AZ192]|uniref:HesA/MoeB/ThiF family protein n=1 Tax=unclassified Enterococcus TaxID=2608891 RepID=UPI003D287A1F